MGGQAVSDLTDFLLARIAEREQEAREAMEPDPVHHEPRAYYSDAGPHRDDWGMWTFHVDPARVLAECDAKRRIVALHSYEWMGPDDAAEKGCECDYEAWPCPTLRLLALPYADHEDYRQEWKP